MKRSQVKHSAAPKTPTALVACLAVLLLTSLWSSHASAATRTRVQNAQSVTPSAVDSPETKAKSENLARNDDDQDSETIDDKSFPGFRFWMAPANAIDHWPWGERKYYPIEIETFNDWLSAIQEREKLERFFNGRYHTGVVATLRLDGRLDGDAFVGSGALDTFHQLPLSASSSHEDSHAPLDANLFPLQPFSMALSSPLEPSDSIDELIPTYPDGQFYLPNLDSKTRRFRWSQRGRVDSLGVTRVDLSFPSAIRTVLNLETPANTTLTSSNGSVEELTNASEPLAPRLWRVTLGATGGTRVTVTPNMTQDVGDKPRLSSYRQETTYRFSREGCETVARFEFEKTDASNIEMELALDAPLALLSVEWNGHAHEFFTDFAAQDANGVRLKLRPQETLGVESVDELKIVAFAPLTLGVSKAPRIRLETQTYSWRETVWRMSASQPLAITATHAHDATQARDAIRSRADVSSTRAFKLFRYDADVSVTLEEQRHAPLFDSATDCHVIGGDVFAKTTLFFNFDANSNGRVELPLADAWDVDAVQTAREEPFSWICQPQSDDANRRVLVLNFERAPEPNQATVAVVSARYLGAVESKIAVDKLCPLDLSGALNGAHALALRAESPKEVKLTTGSGRAIVAPPANVDFVFGEAQIREALPLSLGGARLYFGDQTLDAYASFETNRINYSVDLTCRCDLHADSYVENWRLHCAPANGARVERLVFFVSPSTQGTVAERRVWTWSTASDPDKTYEATRLTPEEAAAMHVPDNVDVYEIRMTTSRSVPFDLNLFHTTPFAFAVQAPLVFFPESVGQTAEFVIKGSLDLPYWVQVDSPTEFSESDMLWDSPSHNALWSSTAPTVATEQYESLTRAYRYKSSIDSDVGDSFRAPGLTIYSYPPENSAYVTDQTSSANALCWNQQYDAYYEVGELVRNRIVFFIENSGRQTVSLFFPETIAPDQLRSVLIDSRPTEWFLREETDSDLRWGVDVCLLPDRRFVCLEIEFVTPEPRGRIIRRLKPSDVTLDMPVLSGKWSVWAPPQFQTYGAHGLFNDGRRDAISWARSVWDDLCAPRERLDHMRSQALRCYSRLGDQSALRFAIGESRSASGQSRVDAATWGDVFGSATVIEQLFAPAIGPANQKDDVEEDATATSADSKTDGVDSNVIDSPFGRLQRSTRPFELYVDRYALARVGVLPSTLTPQTPNASPLECADDMLELSGLFLIYLDENFALLTTREESQRYDNLTTVSACGSNARMVQSYSQARAFRDKIVSSATQRFVSATQWRQSDPTISPWHERSKAEYALGWRRWSTPLARADRGVVVTGSYFLDAITLACFACLLIITWRRLSISIRLLLGVLGVSIAAILVCRLEVQAGARGFAFAAFCSIIARFFTPKRQEDKEKDAVNEPKADQVMTRRHKASEEKDGAVGVAHDASQSHETTAGFVDLKDARVREALLHAEQDDSQRLGENAPERDAKVSMKLCCALALATAIALSASLGLSRVRAQQSPMPTPGAQRNASAPSVTARATDHEFDANPVEETELNQEEQEPYRVFAPIDENQRPTGEYYWIDSEFYQRIRTALRARPRQRNWRVVDAFYQGALNYNSFTETTSLFNLKATYRIVTEEPNVTLALPAVQLTSDGGARFDRQTVSAIYDEAGSELLIELENVEPGEHLLELTLIAPQFTAEENHDAVPQISVPILPCASARLELTASIDAPKVDVPNAMGRVWRSPGSLAADLGAIDRLTLTLEPNGERSNKTSVEVEQYFLLRPRTTQMDARAAFHYQVVGGKVQSLEIECDPSYAFSGYCKCDAVEIDTVEPPTSQNNAMRVTFKKPASGSFTLNVDFVARNFAGIGAISFPKIATRGAHVDKNWLAISPGANVDYTLDLGVTEEQIGDVAVRATEFKAAWGELADSPNVAYDLALVSRDASIHTSVRSPLPEVDLVETLLFRAASVELELDALIEATSELYDLRLTTPHPFVLDSIELTDLNEDQEEGVATESTSGAVVETPDYVLSQEGASLSFSQPLNGRYRLKLKGRAKFTLGQDAAFPRFTLFDVKQTARYERIYCASNVYLQWNAPPSWRVLSQDVGERFAPFKTDSCYLFNQYQVDEEHNEQSQVGDSEEVSEEVIAQQNQETQGDAEVTREQIPWKSVGERPEREEEQQERNQTAQTLPAAFLRVNAPKIDGLERIALYPIQAERASTWKYTWKVAYQLDVHVRNGRLDNLSILADDAFAIDPLESNSPFVMTERSDAAGMKVLTFEPKSHAASLGDDDAISLLFTGSFRNEPSTVRLPRFKLLSPNERADISGVRSVVALANSRRDNPILWRVNMKRVEDSDAREELRDLNRGSRAMASAGGTVTRATTLETPRPATIAQNLEGLLFSFYERNEDSYATLANQEDALKASLAHYSFFLNEQREIFGAALFIIQPNSRDDCVLVAPNNCTILEAQVNGVRRLVERVIEMDQDGQEDQHPQAQQRWYIDLDDTPYTKRLLVTFQMTDTIAQPKRKIFSGGQRFEFHLDFPTLENAEFTHTIWICAFESFDPNQWQTRWNVELALANAEKTARLERQPLAYSESGAPMARMQVETAGALWSALQSDLSFLTDARADDSARLKTRWAHVCRAYATEMGLASILNRSPELLDERQSRAIVTTVDGVALDSSKLDSYFPSQGWNVNSYADAHKFVDAYHELDSDSSDKNSVNADASPQKIWTLHSSDSALLLFGASDAAVYSVQIEATPNPFNFANSYYAVAAFILMTTAIILQLLNIRSRRRYRVASYSVLVALWSSVFFFTEWKTVGLIGAGLLAVGQPTLSAILRSFTRRTRGGAVVRNVTEPAQDASQEDSDESDLVPASPERNASDSDLSTVASSKSDSTSAQVEAFWD